MATISTFLNLPNDLLSRILVGVPLDDHRATASVCRAFRDVINGPKFPALRQRYGFAERVIVVVGNQGTIRERFPWVRRSLAHAPRPTVWSLAGSCAW